MKIAIDVSPLQSGHKIRGVGFYLEYLKRSLLENFPENNYVFFTKKEELHQPIDLVHYPYFDPFFLTLPFHNKYKTVVTVHDLTPLVFPEHFPAGVKGSLRWQLQKFNLKKADAIIADSFASKLDIVKIAGISEEKVFVAHLAAGEEFHRKEKEEMNNDKVRKKYNLPEKFALYVGDVTWNKNVTRVVRAAIKADVPLVMVGKNLIATDYDRSNPWNHDLVEVQQLAKTHSAIIRLGFVSTEELNDLYTIASVFIFPSLYEGFGLPVIEAMKAGCPVITSKSGSLAEVAEDAALIVDPNDTTDIAKAIHKVVDDKQLQRELSKKGLHQAAKFSWKRTAAQTIAVYNTVLNQ